MTTLPTTTQAQFTARLAQNFPAGWANSDALQKINNQNGVIYALFNSIAGQLAFLVTATQYAKNSIIIASATAPELDYASQDYFGSALPRPPGMSDANYRALITANLFPTASTRGALSALLTKLTGKTPRMLEWWNPADTGAANGKSYWGGMVNGVWVQPDSARTPGRWAPSTPYQGYIETAPLLVQQQVGGQTIQGWNGPFYWSRGPGYTPVVPAYGFFVSQPAYVENIYSSIAFKHAFGTVIWVRIVANPQ